MIKVKEQYIFRIANMDDEEDIMQFISEVWKPNHILAKNKDLFEYLHRHGERLNFMLAIDRHTGRIEGLEGFIQYSKELLDIGPVMWSVRKDNRTPYLGIKIVNELKKQTKCRLYASPGSNPRTSGPLHEKLLNHSFGRLSHYYKVNTSMTEFYIGKFESITKQNYIDSVSSWNTVKVFSELEAAFDFEKYKDRLPYKDNWYIKKRYFEHPVYQYKIWICNYDKERCVIIGREINCNGACILRIMDILGDVAVIRHMGKMIEEVLKESNYEYIDVYCKAFMGSWLIEAGFVERLIEDDNIVPNYFQPFLQKNIEIYYNNSHEQAYIFKGDSDQDRPS